MPFLAKFKTLFIDPIDNTLCAVRTGGVFVGLGWFASVLKGLIVFHSPHLMHVGESGSMIVGGTGAGIGLKGAVKGAIRRFIPGTHTGEI